MRAAGGAKLQLVELVRQHAAADVLVVTSSWPSSEDPVYGVFIQRQVDDLIRRGLRCDVLVIWGRRSLLAYSRGAFHVLRACARGRYRAVHAHGGEAGLAALFAVNVPVLISYCGDDLLGRPRDDGSVSLPHRARRWLIRQSARRATATITKSAEMEAMLPQRIRKRNFVIPNGVDADLFEPVDRALARERLSWPLESRVILFAADPRVPRKRFTLAREAVEHVARRLQDVELKVAAGVDPTAMPLWMSAADCLLLTSSIEGSPNVVKEALMCNLPVVSTRVGDVSELLNCVTPSYVAESSPERLADALERCLDEPRRSDGRARSADLRADAVAARVESIYASMLKASGA